jgi:hypothetical protein
MTTRLVVGVGRTVVVGPVVVAPAAVVVELSAVVVGCPGQAPRVSPCLTWASAAGSGSTNVFASAVPAL